MQISLNNQLPVTASDTNFEQPIGLSPLNTPLFDDITFPGADYIALDGTRVSYQTLRLVAVRFVVQQTKNIVRTQISGRNGVVKEYNATGDFIIRCEANLSELDFTFPREQALAFVGLVDVPQEVEVTSRILNQIFGINDVVISDFSLNPGNGAGNVAINLTLESDRVFDLSEFIVRDI